MRGYSLQTAQAVFAACDDPHCHPVFFLLRRAIKANISVMDLADAIGVTKATVYNWCNKSAVPADENLKNLRAFIESRKA